MKKPSLFFMCLLCIGVLFFLPYFKKSVHTSAGTSSAEYEETKIDNEKELQARLEQEVLMTKDPSLGYVPTERLILAEQTAKKLNKAAKENNTLNLLWMERGPNNMGGRSRSVLVDQADVTGNTVFIGSVGGGLWRTTNFLSASPTWTQITSISQNLAITTLAQDPSNPATMYAGTGEGYRNLDAIRGLGVYKSTDAGVTWSLLASTTTGGASVNNFSYIQKILVYTNGDVYASGISASFCNAGGILKSTNGGSTWTRVIGLYTGCGNCSCATNFLGYDIVKSMSGDLYTTTIDGATGYGHIWKSPAGATVGNSGTWTDVTPTGTFQRIQLACSATDNDKVYAIMQGSGSSIGGIRVTSNGGASWANIDNSTSWCNQGSASGTDFSNGQAWYDLAIAVMPNDDQTVFVAGVDMMKTTNGGTTWTQGTQWASGCGLPSIHADIHNIVYLPGSPTQFIVVNDGGIYYTGDGGTTFTNKNSGYRTIQYYSAALHPTSGSNYMLAGAQDNGTHKFSSPGLGSVTTASGGDGGFCFIDQNDPTYQISSYVYAEYFISRNSGTNFSVVADFSGTSNGRFINPADYDNTQKFIYASYSNANLIRISNITAGTPSSATINFPLAGTMRVSAVKVDPNTANRVWVAFSTSSTSSAPQIYYVDNANAGSPVITQVTNPGIPSGAYVSSIDVEQGNANHVIMTVSNYGVASVWESTDLGLTWTSLDNNGVNLPDVPVRWAIFLPSGYSFTGRMDAVGGIMLATELGVWTTTSSNGTTTTWAQSSGLPNVRVDMLAFRNSDETIAAATHGRGLFTTQLQSTLPVHYADFSGTLANHSCSLKWSTSDENSNKGFEVERSYDGLSFTKIGFVAGAGSSNVTKVYTFADDEIAQEENYYRLKQIDLSGNANYSSVILIRDRITVSSSVKVLQNPFISNLDVQLPNRRSSQLKARLIDMSGREVYNRAINTNQRRVRIELSNVTIIKGAYILQITDGNQQYSTKVLKQ